MPHYNAIQEDKSIPFKSAKQREFLFANHPQVAKTFAAHTPSIGGLPQHVNRQVGALKRPAMPQTPQMGQSPGFASTPAPSPYKSLIDTMDEEKNKLG